MAAFVEFIPVNARPAWAIPPKAGAMLRCGE
jgi:hypothetical protein